MVNNIGAQVPKFHLPPLLNTPQGGANFSLRQEDRTISFLTFGAFINFQR